MIVGNGPVGSSESSGSVERAMQFAQRKIGKEAPGGTLRLAVDCRTGFLLTRFEAGRDGKTPYERLKGKKECPRRDPAEQQPQRERGNLKTAQSDACTSWNVFQISGSAFCLIVEGKQCLSGHLCGKCCFLSRRISTGKAFFAALTWSHDAFVSKPKNKIRK